MNDRQPALVNRAAALKLAFDRSFSEPPKFDPATTEELLAVRLGTAHCAIRLSEIRGVFANKKIARVPARSPALLGIASFRGAIIPVYDLHVFLGCPPTSALGWMVIASATPVAFAFEEVMGHARISRDAFAIRDASAAQQSHIAEFFRMHDLVRGVVDLPSIIAAITKQVSQIDS